MSNIKFVLVITGPAGAGKSTVAEKLAKQLQRCVNIDADHVKHMVVSGFYLDKTNPQNPKGWGFDEWPLVGESIGLLAKNFLNNGYSVIINGYIDQPGWEQITKHITLKYKVLLLPHIDTIMERDSGRNEDVIMGEEAVKRHHNYFSGDDFFKDFVRVDSTKLSTKETVDKIRKMLQV